MSWRERAEALEREAEGTGDPDTWAVVSDAWLEVGDPTRAWYARLRSQSRGGRAYGDGLITRARAEEITQALEIDRLASSVTNEERGALELFRFMALQPEQVFAYYGPSPIRNEHIGDDIRTWVGDYLGTVVHRGRVTRPWGNPARIQHVRMRAINGYIYSGTCAIDAGTYCKLRRGKPWLR